MAWYIKPALIVFCFACQAAQGKNHIAMYNIGSIQSACAQRIHALPLPAMYYTPQAPHLIRVITHGMVKSYALPILSIFQYGTGLTRKGG